MYLFWLCALKYKYTIRERKGVTVKIVLVLALHIPSAGEKLDYIIYIRCKQSCLTASLGEDSCLLVPNLVIAIDEDLYIFEMSLVTFVVLIIVLESLECFLESLKFSPESLEGARVCLQNG